MEVSDDAQVVTRVDSGEPGRGDLNVG